MSLAIFGISNSGLNLAVTLLVLIFFVVWLALIVYTYLDARRRLSDPFLVACATIASFFPYIGTAVYAIVRPPEFLEDAHERELEIKAAELRVRQLTESSCPKCEYPIEKNFLRCPNCQHRLKDPCPSCGRPVGLAAGSSAPTARRPCRRASRVRGAGRSARPRPRASERERARASSGPSLARSEPLAARPPARLAPKRQPVAAQESLGVTRKRAGHARCLQRGAEPQTTAKEPQP